MTDFIRGVLFSTALLVCVPASRPALCADEPPPLMVWTPPPAGPKPGMIAGLDKDTLTALTESGVLQYFQPRSEKNLFDVVVGMMIHAPVEEVWKIAADYQGMCGLLTETFDSCETISQEGRNTRMRYRIHTSVLKFSFNMEIVDEITETDPWRWHLETVEGDLKGREVDLLLVPVGEDRTMVFMRYFGALRSMGSVIRLTLAMIPELESPVYSSATTYHLRSYKNEAEKRVGFQPPAKPPALDYESLDPKTMDRLCGMYGGLIREDRKGKIINAMAITAIDAPRDKVWAVMTDFEHYDSFFPDSTPVVKKREGNEVSLHQSIKQIDVLVFSYGFDLECEYQLEPPRRMSYKTVEGDYAGSYGDFVLVPRDNGRKTFVYATIRSNMENDDSFTMKIVKSGAFPFDAAVNMFFARNVLNKFKAEVGQRK